MCFIVQGPELKPEVVEDVMTIVWNGNKTS